MIDFQKELAKFDFFNVSPEFTGYYTETVQVMEIFNSTLKRISKELNYTNIQVEEILSQQLEENEKDKQIAEQQRMITACEEEKRSLVWGLVAVLDQLEDIYRYSLQNEDSALFEQMQLLWKDVATKLLLQGINRIEGDNTVFNSKIHSAVQVKEDNNISNGVVLEVIRCGYVYKTHLLRKAQVIVNKIEGGL
ncbi:MAG: nucleotide exchange factor GrpE [Clostridia bacterium]|nr:nucleotide exchange factor GrpE [Clostridia bacterium]MDD4049161.1 nucleotide exchange factor GrpE [Clostridia bacterium]